MTSTVLGSRPLEEPVDLSWWTVHRQAVIVAAGRLVLLVAVLALWEYAAGRWIDDLLVSRPSAVAEQFAAWLVDGTLLRHGEVTVTEVVWGFILGASAGAVLAFVLAPLTLVQRIIDPYVYGLYSLPKVALAPLFIVWFGIGISMKILLAAITVFFLVFLNTLAGIRQVDRGLIDAVRLMGCTRLQLARTVILPASLVGLFTGLKVAIPYALIGAVIGELVASNRGIGYLVSDSASRFNTAGVFAALIVLTLMAWVLNFVVSLIDSRLSRWRG
jgi:NitT/TauT family transport system permease protein